MFESKLIVADAATRIRLEFAGSPEVEQFVRFIESSQRGVCR